jgi:protein SCO1/2
VIRLGAIAILLALVGHVGADDTRPPLLRGVGIEQRLGTRIPLDLRFRDSTDREVRLGDLFRERPVVLAFAYYECPMLCSLVLNGLAGTLGLLSLDAGRDFDVVTVSIDPGEGPSLATRKKDEILKRYDRPGAAAGWHFLTGDEDAIRRLADATGFHYAYDAARDEYAHAAAVLFLTPDGRIARYLQGVELPGRDVRLALVESSRGKIGTLTDQLLLLCYHYDPATGKYGRIALGSVRAGGILTVLGLGGFVFVMWRRERRGGLGG